MKNSELLLPVGDMDMCMAAIHNGADAVYVGAPGFNARGRTKDHGFEELEQIIKLCHLYGVKVHLAFNILIFEAEMEKILDYIKTILALGPDALIVQDLGLAHLIKQMAPWQTLHASTQMTITNELAINEVSDLNFSRFVLGRECSLSEIKAIRENTDKELEVFVHGALCVAYSGQCFTSEALGGRSANRGQCAQSCRLEYELIVDGVKTTTHKGAYAVSPKDLMGLEQVPALQEIGVESFKVEGRLKGPDYVASVARHYKDAIIKKSVTNLEQKKKELKRTYSRGFFSGWLDGVHHQNLVDGSYSNHRGQLIGQVIKVDQRQVFINSKEDVQNGVGLLFAGSSKSELGSFVYKVSKQKDSSLAIELARDFDLSKIKIGHNVFLNKDPALEKELAKSWKDKEQLKKIVLSLKVILRADQLPSVTATDEDGNCQTFTGTQKLERAKQNPASNADIEKGLGGFGATAFAVGHFDIQMDTDLFIPNQMLKSLRKEITLAMEQLRTVVAKVEFNEPVFPDIETRFDLSSRTNVLLRDQKQLVEFLHAAQKNPLFNSDMVGVITLDYEFGKHYQESLALLKEHGFKSSIATTRILKPKELHNLKLIERLAPDQVLVRNLGALNYFKKVGLPMVGDFSLNVTNSLSAHYLMNKGLERITMGLDLNQWQVGEILGNSAAHWFEIIVHQHMPEFHMEHCVFAAYLSQGSSFKDCGKPCEKHRVSLKDFYGNIHHLAADHECRNTMFKAQAQAATSQISNWRDQGVANYRIEGLWEDGSKILEKVTVFQQVINETMQADQALASLGMMESFGVSAGVLAQKHNYVDRKKNL